jgi:hypothetical protein
MDSWGGLRPVRLAQWFDGAQVEIVSRGLLSKDIRGTSILQFELEIYCKKLRLT